MEDPLCCRKTYRAAGAIAAIVALVACGGGAKHVGGGDSPWLSLLALIPNTDEMAAESIYMNDYARVRRLFGIQTPVTRSAEEFLPYVAAIMLERLGEPRGLHATGRSPFSPEYISTAYDAWAAELGIDLFEIDEDVVVGEVRPPLTILRGRFDAAAVRKAVTTDPNWSDRLQELSHGGKGYYSWGESGRDLRRRSAVRPLGDVLQMGLIGNNLATTYTRASLEAFLDNSSGRARSLADREEFRLPTGALAAAATYSAFLATDRSQSLAEFNALGCARHIVAFALGVGKDGSGYYVAGALLARSEQDARASFEALKSRLRVNGDVSGSLLTFRLAGTAGQGRFYATFVAGWPDVLESMLC